MIYFDNAATGGFKPYLVTQATEYAIKYLIANPGRSGHKLSKLAEEFIFKCRKQLAEFFNCNDLSRNILTKNCSEALNIAIYGTVKKGGHIIITCYEHNSVIRPIKALASLGLISYSVAYPKNTAITTEDIKPLIKQNTYLVIVNGASNVTGEIADIGNIGALLKPLDIIFMVDGAQLAGHYKIDMQKDNIDILALAGHKGLHSIMGCGALLFNKNINIKPVFCGGTGTETFAELPSSYPELLEYGTPNLPAICSLYEGLIYTKDNLDFFSKNLTEKTNYCIELLKTLKFKIYSKANPCGIVSFSCDKIDSIALAEILSDKYDIATRGGFHCAPLAHSHLKTIENGLLRVSFSPQNTQYEIKKLYYALKEIIAFWVFL